MNKGEQSSKRTTIIDEKRASTVSTALATPLKCIIMPIRHLVYHSKFFICPLCGSPCYSVEIASQKAKTP